MEKISLRRRAFWRSPRAPPSTPCEMSLRPQLRWESALSRSEQRFSNSRTEEQEYSESQRRGQSAMTEQVARSTDTLLPPVSQYPFPNDFAESAFSDTPSQGAYSAALNGAFIKREPYDDSISDATLAHPDPGYMERSSPFGFESTCVDKSVRELFPIGDATINYLNENGDIETIGGLNQFVFEERCPLLAQAFEPSSSGTKLFLEALSTLTAEPFLRFVYTGSYAVAGNGGDIYEDVPTSLLLHCQLYRLGDIFDLPELKQQAYINVMRQCEFGCSSPDKPIDLCAAVKYMYKHLREHRNLVDTVICYCVTCFLRHRLIQDEEFSTMAYNLRPFHQDLCKESMKRDFEDETAAAIIQMPFEPYSPPTYASREDVDCIFRFHGSNEPETEGSPKKRKRLEPPSMLLAFRQKSPVKHAVDDTLTEEEPEEDNVQIDFKRRSAGPAEPCIKEEPRYLSDSDYEVVAGPAPVEEMSSDSEVEGNAVALVECPAIVTIGRDCSLPLRLAAGQPTSGASVAVDADSDPESDWSLV